VTILSISLRHHGRPGLGLTSPILQNFLHPSPEPQPHLRRAEIELPKTRLVCTELRFNCGDQAPYREANGKNGTQGRRLLNRHRGSALQLLVRCLERAEMRPHQALPKFPVIWNEKMQELVDDYIIDNIIVESQKLLVKIHVATRRARCPLVAHWSDGE
jgi:hypothetical protein